MKNMEILEKIVMEHSMNPFVSQLTDNTDLIEDLEIDSLGLVDIIICIEEELNISFPDDFLILDNLCSYSKIVAKVQELLCGGKENV